MNEKGMTLIEILAAIIILSIIVVSIIPMFVQSSRSNQLSKNMMDATYIAENAMEEMYNLISTTVPVTPTTPTTSSVSFDSITTALQSNGYTLRTCSDEDGDVCYDKNNDGHTIFIQLKESDESIQLVNVNIKVFNAISNNQEAQMESLVSWKQ